MSKESSSSGGIGVFGLLGVAFGSLPVVIGHVTLQPSYRPVQYLQAFRVVEGKGFVPCDRDAYLPLLRQGGAFRDVKRRCGRCQCLYLR